MPWGFIIRGVLTPELTQSYGLALSLYPGDVSIKRFVKSSSHVLWEGWRESFVPIIVNVDMVGIEFENLRSSRVSDPFCVLSNPTFCWSTLSTPGFWTNCQYRKKPHLTLPYMLCLCAQKCMCKCSHVSIPTVMCVCVHKSACVGAHMCLYLLLCVCVYKSARVGAHMRLYKLLCVCTKKCTCKSSYTPIPATRLM